MIRYFGIRHHGPGCARSLLGALEQMAPDCVLIEGPPEGEAVLHWAVGAEMEPPVALLLHCPDDPSLAAFYPFADFSPEWHAIRHGLGRNVPVRFIDVPQAHDLAWRKEEAGKPRDDVPDHAGSSEDAEVAPDQESRGVEPSDDDVAMDPLDWLGRAAGYDDGEAWWNEMVEERGDLDHAGLFEGIREAMTTLRAEVPRKLSPATARREAIREAFMRKRIREAEKEGFTGIAVICGAWHVPALADSPPAKADAELLKGLPKVKVAATWAPWTYGRLAAASGYGAGVASPGWYEFLWRGHEAKGVERSVGWMARVARLMREEDIDCSSAHVIEAARLSETLAALRSRPRPGLDDLNEAVRAVICLGDDAPLRLVRERLIVGERLGKVPADVPTVPLQQDLERQQRSLRLKPEALAKDLDLDLRNEGDLARSHLLHRLNLLGIAWGRVSLTGRSAKGSFHEVWRLQWQPEFAVALIEASRFGGTVLEASTSRAVEAARSATSLPELSALVDRVLLASLSDAIPVVTRALEDLTAVSADVSQLLESIPALANVFRYGNVRKTDASLVGHVLDSLVLRACIGLPGACSSLDDDAAAIMRARVGGAHRAVQLVSKDEHRAQWLPALTRVAGLHGGHGLVCGAAARLLFDESAEPAEDTSARMSRALSRGAEPAAAAAWLDGFLFESATVLIHDDRLWGILDAWMASLSDEAFIGVLPFVRRALSTASSTERRQLGEKAQRPSAGGPSQPPDAPAWNEERAKRPLETIRLILGIKS